MRSVGGGSLFEREHHRQVAAVLESLNADLLVEHACLFGGGTAIVLTHGEYRESADIDFLVSSLAGYRTLRQLVTSGRGLQALARTGASLEQAREVRADQYGLRTRVRALGTEIKL
jgi:predicted nucleotidyltransferase